MLSEAQSIPASVGHSGVVADHIAAVNRFDEDAIVATFAPDADEPRFEFEAVDTQYIKPRPRKY